MKVTLDGQTLVISDVRGPGDLTIVRGLPSRRFSQVSGNWLAPHTIDNLAHLAKGGVEVGHIQPATLSSYRVEGHGGLLHLFVPGTQANVAKCRGIPDYRTWSLKHETWVLKPTARNLAYLMEAFPDLTWDAAALSFRQRWEQAQRDRVDFAQAKRTRDAEVLDYKFGTTPFQHQAEAFKLSRDRAAFALLMEQGTGKTKILIDTAAWLYTKDRIDAVLVIAPNSVKTNWVTDELPIHTPPYLEWRAAYWSASQTKAQRSQIESVFTAPGTVLRWLVMNVEALATERGQRAAEAFLRRYRVLMIVDESSRIKSPSAARTKAAVKLGKLAKYRRIASGTPITQGPLDLYPQFTFLDPTILGFGSFYAFRNHFAIMGGWNAKQVIGYAHLEELTALIDPHSYRVLRADCLDLPDKIYQKLEVDLSPEQRRVYTQMREEMLAEFGDQAVSETLAMIQALRLQQITGGFIPLPTGDDEGTRVARPIHDAVGEKNPKIQALMELAEQTQGKMIIWARFRAELDLISRQLRAVYGDPAVVEFHGGVSEDARIAARTAFQDLASPVRFFVAQVSTGGLGITLTAAQTVVYYSNTFSLEDRLQSEDRAMRIGQTKHVTYVDIVARDTTDVKILRRLRSKKQVADQVTGDRLSEWI